MVKAGVIVLHGCSFLHSAEVGGSMVRRILLSSVILIVLTAAQHAGAQQDPRTILIGVIQQLQTGQPNPMWYGPQLWNTIAMQTGNTGYYAQLAQLGPVTNVFVNNQIQLPAGPVYAMTAHHQNGVSTWNLGISMFSNRIEYANFVIGSGTPLPPQPAPSPPFGPSPKADPASEACKKFPNLC